MASIILALIALAGATASFIVAVKAEKKADSFIERMANVGVKLAEQERQTEKLMTIVNEIIEKDKDPETTRRGVLLRQLNDEMEKQLATERAWNAGISNILNYSIKDAVGGDN